MKTSAEQQLTLLACKIAEYTLCNYVTMTLLIVTVINPIIVRREP